MCIFCKIANHEIPTRNVYEDDDVLAFHDISPQAPVHVLVIPKRHVASLNEATDADQLLFSKLLRVATKVAEAQGVGTSGYRVVFNSGMDAGQSVLHVHAHVLGGRSLQWPPG